MKKPSNPKLYAMFVAQARAKYHSYPNPGASAWVHKQYIQHGGQFVETTEKDRQMGILKKKLAHKKQEELAKKEKGGKDEKGKR